MFCARCGHAVGVADRVCQNCQLDLMNTSGAIRMTRGTPQAVAVWTPSPTSANPDPRPVVLGRPTPSPVTPLSAASAVPPDEPVRPAPPPMTVVHHQPTPVRTEEQMDALIAAPSTALAAVWEAREEEHRRRNRIALALLSLALLAVVIPLAIMVERLLNPPPLIEKTPTPTSAVSTPAKPAPTKPAPTKGR